MAKLRFNGNISEAAGAVGRLQYRRSLVGQQITERGYSVPSESPARLAANARFERTSDAWALLSESEQSLWTRAAALDSRRDPVTLKVYTITNRALFMGLGCKYLQINGLGSAIPAAPPLIRFTGDTIGVSTSKYSNMAVWTSTGPNRTGVQTELLAQRLASKDRKPVMDDYASVGFVTFDPADGNEATVDLGPGIWALAYRFVSPATGEERGIVPTNTIVLGYAVVQGGVDDDPTTERKAA